MEFTVTSILPGISLSLAAVLAACYYLAFKTTAKRFHLLMAAGWLLNYLAISFDQAVVGQDVDWQVYFVIYAASTVLFSLAALDIAGKRKRTLSLAALILVMFLGALVVVLPPEVANAIQAGLSALVLASFGAAIQANRGRTCQMFAPPALLDNRSQWPATQAPMLLAGGLYLWAVLQILYLLSFQSSSFFLALFLLAQTAKAVHLVGVLNLIVLGALSAERLLARKSEREELGALAAAIEHDARTPLSVLRNSLASLRLAQTPVGKAKRFLQAAEGSVERISAVINIVSAIRLTPESYGELSQELPLQTLLRDAVRSFKKLQPHQRLSLEIRDGAKSLQVRTIRAGLAQAFLNILLNAEESIRRSGRAGAITCQATVRNGFAQVLIRDLGTGISEELIERVFDPFFSTKAGSNRGIGLYIAKRVVDLHEGQIAIESDGMSYTCVTVEIPAIVGV